MDSCHHFFLSITSNILIQSHFEELRSATTKLHVRRVFRYGELRSAATNVRRVFWIRGANDGCHHNAQNRVLYKMWGAKVSCHQYTLDEVDYRLSLMNFLGS